MAKKTRRKFCADLPAGGAGLKAKVALEAIKNQKTMAQLSQQFDVNAITIAKWKAEFLERMPALFSGKHESVEEYKSPELEKLYAQIGQLKVENDFLKKSAKKSGIPDSELKW